MSEVSGSVVAGDTGMQRGAPVGSRRRSSETRAETRRGRGTLCEGSEIGGRGGGMEVMRTGFGDIAVVFWSSEWPDSRTERSRTGGEMSEAGGWLERVGRRYRGICSELLKAGKEGAGG